MILQGFQFPHVNVPLRAHGYTGRMPSGEEFRFQSPYDGVAIVPWPLQYVSATGMYDGPVGATGHDGHRCSAFTDFRYDDTTPLQAQALTRLHDRGADHTDLDFFGDRKWTERATEHAPPVGAGCFTGNALPDAPQAADRWATRP